MPAGIGYLGDALISDDCSAARARFGSVMVRLWLRADVFTAGVSRRDDR